MDDSHMIPDVKYVIEHSKRLIFEALDELEGQKTIVWNSSDLMRRINVFVGASALSTHGVVKHQKIDQYIPSQTPYTVFLLPGTLDALENLCKYMDQTPTSKSLYQVYFVPEAWYVVREKLKEREKGKYWERLEAVKELPLWWLPRDGECLGLGAPQLPSRLLINGDWTHLHRCAVALHQLLSVCIGKIPIYSKGKWADDVARMVNKMRAPQEEDRRGNLGLNRVVIIDRWLDPITPLLTQLTYGGILDELYGINMMGEISIPTLDFEERDQGDPYEMTKIPLNDELFHRLKHVHINAIGQQLAAILQELKEDETYDKDKLSIAEAQALVKKLPKILQKKKHCQTHMRLAEMVHDQLYAKLVDQIKVQKDLLESSESDKVVPFIEDSIMEAADLTTVLRLISLHSLTASGLKPAVLSNYRRTIMQSYGIDGVNRLLKMQKMGLVREKGGSGKLSCDHSQIMFPPMRKQYQLIMDGVRESDTYHPAYAYSGYCSLLHRMVEEGDRIKWVGWNKCGEHGGRDDDRTAVLVVGGVTRAEVALISSIPNVSLVLSSAVISGNSLLDNLTNI